MTTPKYIRKAIEKIWNVLQEIEEKRQLTAKDKEIKLAFVPPSFKGTAIESEVISQDRDAILHKFESMRVIFGLREQLEGMDDEHYWHFRLGEKYEVIFSIYGRKYREIAREYRQSKQLEEIEMKDPVYEVKYSEKSREILVNNFLLKKPDAFGENEIVFAYLYKNPNRAIPLEDIKKEMGEESLTKSIHKILENLGFSGELRKAFFKVAGTKVLFRNPLTKKDLEELGIKHLPLLK